MLLSLLLMLLLVLLLMLLLMLSLALLLTGGVDAEVRTKLILSKNKDREDGGMRYFKALCPPQHTEGTDNANVTCLKSP
ncbi:hypothetical protein B0I37DRAFT_33731 [Chaetomium sp. MPI-CAGE-AT-0009]|nr:hypothetical protein B0I37DRAFT_33731 [Chaetomium sp. MPI-CAGE-AT-0009]